MRTARSIEELGEKKTAKSNGKEGESLRANNQPATQKHKRGDASYTARIASWKWQPGHSGNPSGRPKHDLAQEIAAAILAENGPQLYAAYLRAALKGNGYIFETLANRAFGKLKESVAIDVNPLRDLSDDDLKARIADLEKQLGVIPALPPADEPNEPKPN